MNQQLQKLYQKIYDLSVIIPKTKVLNNNYSNFGLNKIADFYFSLGLIKNITRNSIWDKYLNTNFIEKFSDMVLKDINESGYEIIL